MELIDEQGRILGLVNIIDALVLLLVLAVVVAGVALVSQSEERTPGSDFRTVTVEMKAHNVPPEVAAAVQVGMTEDRDGRTSARIIDKEVDPAMIVVQTDRDELVLREHPVNKTVSLTVDLAVQTTNGDRQFHDRPLRIGNTVRLDLGTTVVRGTIVAME